MQHTVYLRHLLVGVLDEEDKGCTARQTVVGRACQTTEHGEIAAYQEAFSAAWLVEVVVGYVIGRQRTFQDVVQHDADAVGAVLCADGVQHRAVYAHHASLCHRAVQGCDVAKADEPFGLAAEVVGSDARQQLHGAIAATCAHDGTDGTVGKGPTQVGSALVGCACKAMIFFQHIGPHDRLVAPLPQDVAPLADGFLCRRARR